MYTGKTEQFLQRPLVVKHVMFDKHKNMKNQCCFTKQQVTIFS